MDYNTAMSRYFECRREIELLQGELAVKIAPLQEKMKLLMQWIEEKAKLDGLKNVGVHGVGTGYWETHTSARVMNRTVFKEFCDKNDQWDLMEIRAASAQIKKYIETTNKVPEGINFGQVQVFKIRSAAEKAKGD